MSNWIIVLTNQQTNIGPLTGREIVEKEVKDKLLGLTRNSKAFQKGDRVLFYVGAPEKAFIGMATLASESYRIPEAQRQERAGGIDLFDAEYGVDLERPEIWAVARPMREITANLDLTSGRPDYGIFLRGGPREISDNDFERIVQHQSGSGTPARSEVGTTESSASEHLFALERHLEDFIENNWAGIHWGRNLVLYSSDANNGRQFPAGKWSIDFLTTDRAMDSFVVIELKRNHSSDDTVGQVLRYMGWVRENLARPGQKVEGIIVCSEVDESLRLAVKELQNVSVKQFKVSFSLTDPEL